VVKTKVGSVLTTTGANVVGGCVTGGDVVEVVAVSVDVVAAGTVVEAVTSVAAGLTFLIERAATWIVGALANRIGAPVACWWVRGADGTFNGELNAVWATGVEAVELMFERTIPAAAPSVITLVVTQDASARSRSMSPSIAGVCLTVGYELSQTNNKAGTIEWQLKKKHDSFSSHASGPGLVRQGFSHWD
jgi:hypothetical protein